MSESSVFWWPLFVKNQKSLRKRFTNYQKCYKDYIIYANARIKYGGNEMNKLKENFGFDFWQKFGKALMVVIAVMPAAGLMISIGKTIAMINPNAAPLVITGGFLEQIGWGLSVTFTSCLPLPLVVVGLRNVQEVLLQQVLHLS